MPPITRSADLPPAVNVNRLQRTCTSDDGLAVWGDRQVEHSKSVASQRGQLAHGWVLPDHDLVLRVAVGADNLVHIL